MIIMNAFTMRIRIILAPQCYMLEQPTLYMTKYHIRVVQLDIPDKFTVDVVFFKFTEQLC